MKTFWICIVALLFCTSSAEYEDNNFLKKLLNEIHKQSRETGVMTSSATDGDQDVATDTVESPDSLGTILSKVRADNGHVDKSLRGDDGFARPKETSNAKFIAPSTARDVDVNVDNGVRMDTESTETPDNLDIIASDVRTNNENLQQSQRGDDGFTRPKGVSNAKIIPQSTARDVDMNVDNDVRTGTDTSQSTRPEDDEVDELFTSHQQEDSSFENAAIQAEWFMQTGRDFHGWRDELNFPGSTYLLDIIDEYLITELYLEDDMKDPFNPDESLIASFAADLDTVTDVIDDPDTLALIYTRRITEFIQRERMMCAASKFDMISMKAMMMEISSLFTDDNESMQDFLLTLLLELPTVPGVQWDPNNVAIQLSLRIHDRIFNDTVHYLLGRSYRDVTMFSLGLYNALRSFFSSTSLTNKAQFVAIVTDILYYDADVHCPTDREMKMQRRDALWDLTKKLEEVETIELCMGMRSFIEANFFSAGSPPSLMATTHDYEKTMQEMCDYVRSNVNHLYLHLEEYEHMLLQRNAEGLKALFQKYLSTSGLLTLVNALEALRWIPNISVMDTVGITKANWTLPANSVIQNAQSDISYWQSFMDNLNPDTFTQMDLTDIKAVIQQWIDGKHKVMEKFTSKDQEK